MSEGLPHIAYNDCESLSLIVVLVKLSGVYCNSNQPLFDKRFSMNFPKHLSDKTKGEISNWVIVFPLDTYAKSADNRWSF